MVRGGLGGGNTQTGIHFEGRVDIVTYLNDEVDGYRCDQKTLNNKNQSMGFNIYYNGNLVAESFKKHELYRYYAHYFPYLTWIKQVSLQPLRMLSIKRPFAIGL